MRGPSSASVLLTGRLALDHGITVMALAENVPVGVPPGDSTLYTAQKVCNPGVVVIAATALARTGSLPNTRNENGSPTAFVGITPSTLNDMKPPTLPVEPLACAVRMMTACVPVVTVTHGPGSAGASRLA